MHLWLIGAIISRARTDTESIISPALNSLSQYVPPLNSSLKYRARPSMFVSTVSGLSSTRTQRHWGNCLTSATASRVGSQANQLAFQASRLGKFFQLLAATAITHPYCTVIYIINLSKALTLTLTLNPNPIANSNHNCCTLHDNINTNCSLCRLASPP